MAIFRAVALARRSYLLVQRRFWIHVGDHVVGFRIDGSGYHSARFESGEGTRSGGGPARWTTGISVLQHLQHFPTAPVEALQLVQCLRFQIRSVRMKNEY